MIADGVIDYTTVLFVLQTDGVPRLHKGAIPGQAQGVGM